VVDWNKVDWNKLAIEKFINNGLSPKEAEYLSNAMKDNSSYINDDYAKALHRKTTKISAPQDKIDSKEFMDSFRKTNDKSMTTEKFFDNKIDYRTDPGAGKVSDKYLEAIKTQRNKPRLVTDEGMANIKNIGSNAAGMALGYLISKTPDLQLTIHGAGEGSDVLPDQKEKDIYNEIRKNLMMKGINK
jgi:SpoVK/Ycf46/Vps4 family AAA+-type ATPase